MGKFADFMEKCDQVRAKENKQKALEKALERSKDISHLKEIFDPKNWSDLRWGSFDLIHVRCNTTEMTDDFERILEKLTGRKVITTEYCNVFKNTCGDRTLSLEIKSCRDIDKIFESILEFIDLYKL